MSKYIWKGKKARVKYKTLLLKKEKGGYGLPCFREYYCAAQLRPLICLCCPDYTAEWKDVEGTIETIPVVAVMADPKLQNRIHLADHPISQVMISAWNEAIKICGLGNSSKVLRWCAYDSDFTPNQHDDRFKEWISKGLTNYYSFVHKGSFQSFETLKRKYNLCADDFFRYLQVRHYFNQDLKVHVNNLGFVETFISLTESRAVNKTISRLYNAILRCKKDSTVYVKVKWEKEAGLTVSDEDWDCICRIQWTTTTLKVWREFCWKSIIRFFITPAQKKYRGTCWRCGGDDANHFHIFWNCQVIHQYWSQINEHLQNVFSTVLPLNFESMFLCNIQADNLNCLDKKLLYILLAASKKALMRRWLKPEPPSTEAWINAVKEIYTLEKLSFSVKMQRDTFYKMWSKWTEYVKPVSSDFL